MGGDGKVAEAGFHVVCGVEGVVTGRAGGSCPEPTALGAGSEGQAPGCSPSFLRAGAELCPGACSGSCF